MAAKKKKTAAKRVAKRRPAVRKAKTAKKKRAARKKKAVRKGAMRQTPPPKPASKLPPRQKTVDAVEEASRESFPASDPPSWTPVTGEER